jgi:hypothetical protein
VLARKHSERNEDVKALFEKVPYLNSSLFEPTDIEHSTLFISNLRDDKMLPIYSSTVLKDKKGKKRSGELNALEYLFEFLNAYDFSSEGAEAIQEDNKTLINASVLGLIFEKINGYKDGSFFTPGFITMYMCRETIRKAVVQKFNESKDWDCKDLDQLYDRIEDRKEANELINSLKICDPAVGSGHFLVSALNEIIAIKNDLNILQDRTGRRLKEYQVEVVNDELIVTDEEGELFEYNPSTKESQRIQEALFHEKQQIIENCLFGVDINPNSVKICRLRLWIELLKNAYYKNETELETLPNIDINIKCGNSLISRFDLDADLSKALKESKWNIDSYRVAVDTYRNAQNKEQKREMEKIIHDIKNDFRSEISSNDPKVKRLQKVKGELFLLTNQTHMFEMSKKEKATWNKKLEKLSKESKKLETEIREIKDNKIYENAFEWRFEFPEVLDDNGEYVGFDVVIGNPPYGRIDFGMNYFAQKYITAEGRFDLFEAFIEKGLLIIRSSGLLKYILPNTLLTNLYSQKVRRNLLENFFIDELTNFGMDVFEEATVHTCIIGIKNSKKYGLTRIREQVWTKEELASTPTEIDIKRIVDKNTCAIRVTLSSSEVDLFSKLTDFKTLKDLCYIRQCIKTGNDKVYVKKSSVLLDEPWKKSLRGKNMNKYQILEDDLYLKYGDFLARNWQNKSFYETPKIGVRETGNKIIAALDLENRYFLSSLYAIYPKGEFNISYLKCFLAILNSSMATFFVKKIAYDLTKGAFTKVRTNQLGQLPIPPFQNYEDLFANKIDEIQIQKKENPTGDTTSLENEIDQLVYEIYGLTEEEIALVEKS